MSGNKKIQKLGDKVKEIAMKQLGVDELAQKLESGESVLVVAEDGTTEVLEASTPTEQQNTDESSNNVVEPKEPTGTTTEVKKVVVPHKVESSKLDSYDSQIINLVLGSNLLAKVLETIENAPKAKENMVNQAVTSKQEIDNAYRKLMLDSDGMPKLIEPDTEDYEALQAIMVSRKQAKDEIERVTNLNPLTLAEESMKSMRDSLVREIEAIRLSVFGKETTNLGGKPKSGRAFNWNREETLSYWRNNEFLQIAPMSWLSVEYREEHDLRVSETDTFIAFDAKTGKIAYKVTGITSFSNLFFQITCQQLVAKGENLPESDTWGMNQTTLWSKITEQHKKDYPCLTQEALRVLVGDKGTSFDHNISISEEVGMDDSTALPVETIESGESVTA